MAKQKTELEFSLIDGVSKGMSAIFKGMTDIGVSIQKVTGFAGDLSNALGGVNLLAPLQAIPAALVDLESAMSRAGQATGATVEQLKQLTDVAQEAGTATGFTAVEAAGGLEALGRAGLNATEAMAALTPVLALAKVANIEVQDAAGRVADTLDQFGLAAGKAASVADVLAAAASASGTNLKQLSDGLTQAGPVARTVGLSFETTAAALGLLAKNGIEGGKAGGSLRVILEALADPTSKFSAALTDAGIKSRDFATVLAELSRKGAAGEVAIQSLGAKGTAAVQALLREGGGALQKFTTEIKNSEDAALRAAKLINDNLKGAFTQLQNTVINAGTDFFEPILGPLAQGLEDAAAAIGEFARSPEFANLRESFRIAFEEGLQFLRNFLQEFEFKEAIAKLQEFVDTAGAKLEGFANKADEVFAVIRVAAEGLGAVFNGLQTVIATTFALIAQSQATLIGLWPDLTGQLQETHDVLQSLADEGFKQAGINADELKGNIEGLGNAFDKTSEAAKNHDAIVSRSARGHKNLTEETLAASRALSESKFAFEGSKDAATGTAEAAAEAAAKIAAVRKEFVDLTARLGEEIAAGKTSKELEPTVARLKELQAEIEKVDDAASSVGPKLEKSGKQGAEAFRETAAAANSASAEIEKTSDTATRSANSAEAGTASLKDAVGGLYSFFAQTSKAAADLFAELQTGANFGSIGLESYGKAIEAADQGTQRAIATAKAFGDASIAAFNDFAESGKIAGNEAAGAFFTTEGALDSVEQAIKAGVGAFGLMDAQTLSNVQAALDRARSKVQAIEAAARSATDSLAAIGDQLEEQALRDSGNEEEIARRAYERKVQEIQALAETAGAAGQAAAARAEALARDELNRALKRIAEKKAAEIAAANETADARIAANARVDTAQTQQAAASSAGQITPRTNAQTAAAAATIAPQRAGDNFSLNVQLGTIPENRAQLDRLARQLLERIKELQRLSR